MIDSVKSKKSGVFTHLSRNSNGASNGVEVNNRTKRRISELLLKKTAHGVLKGEKTQGYLSIAVVGPAESRKLNKQYRKKDTVANVLSFPSGNDNMVGEAEGYLGEVVLCPAEIAKDAVTYGMMQEQALMWMLVHGILHILGYDHEAAHEAVRMEQREQHYLHTHAF
jgi:probable rRNA maturation factor